MNRLLAWLGCVVLLGSVGCFRNDPVDLKIRSISTPSSSFGKQIEAPVAEEKKPDEEKSETKSDETKPDEAKSSEAETKLEDESK